MQEVAPWILWAVLVAASAAGQLLIAVRRLSPATRLWAVAAAAMVSLLLGVPTSLWAPADWNPVITMLCLLPFTVLAASSWALAYADIRNFTRRRTLTWAIGSIVVATLLTPVVGIAFGVFWIPVAIVGGILLWLRRPVRRQVIS